MSPCCSVAFGSPRFRCNDPWSAGSSSALPIRSPGTITWSLGRAWASASATGRLATAAARNNLIAVSRNSAGLPAHMPDDLKRFEDMLVRRQPFLGSGSLLRRRGFLDQLIDLLADIRSGGQHRDDLVILAHHEGHALDQPVADIRAINVLYSFQ